VAHLFDSDIEVESRREPARRRWLPFAVAAALAMLGVASALLWHTFGDGLPALPSFASVTGPSAAPAVAAADKPVGLKDFQAFQQQIAEPMQSTAQLLAAQQAELKRLSDQVSALTAKIDAIEHPPASAQAAVAAPPPVAPRKKPVAAKLPAGISTGGAPLPPPR
jgi:cell division protein FtsB